MTTDDTTSATVAVVRRTWTSAATAVVLSGCLGVLVTVPWWASEARQRDLIELFTLLALAQMWNLLAGYAGLVSIGQQAFIGIGAYGLLLLGDRADIHPFVAVALAGLAAAADLASRRGARLPPPRGLLRHRHVGHCRGFRAPHAQRQ